MPEKSTFYSIFSHTADLGISVTGCSCEDLFRNAGLALLELIVKNKAPKFEKMVKISLDGIDLPDLMVRWLSEILYLFEGERLVVTAITIDSIDSNNIKSTLSVMKFNSQENEILREIKAVTYHQIEVEKKNNIWTASIIFDL